MAQNLEDQITLLRHEVAQYKSIIKEMSVPLIESSLNNTLLMPLSGHLFQERITQIEAKLFNYLQEHRHVKTVIMDFTGISHKNTIMMSTDELSDALRNLHTTLTVVGIRVVYTGFQPEVIFNFVKSGFNEQLETYPTYRLALEHLYKELHFFTENLKNED